VKRRFFLLAAPAIVAAPSLMKVSALVMPALPSAVNYGVMEITPEMIRIALRTNALLQWAQDRALIDSISGISDLMRGAQSA